MDTPLIGLYMKQVENSHGESLNHWVSGIMHITVQTCYDIQYLIMHLIGYINYPTEPAFIDLRHGMEYHMHHPHEPIIDSRNIFSKMKSQINVSSDQVMQKSTKIRNAPNSSIYIVMHITQIDISGRHSVTSTAHLFNVTVFDWCVNKQSETYRSISN